MRLIDHVSRGSLVPLATYVRDLRNRSRDADWSGDVETARRLDREAEDAIRSGADPVPMF